MNMTADIRSAPYDKRAPASVPIHDALALRWSPRAFSSAALSAGEMEQLFEAARWAPSASNEQPWRFLVATRDHPSGFTGFVSCLNASNQVWARNAAALVMSCVRLDLASKPQPNRTALYDLGQAVAFLSVQATAMGIAVHQIAGLDLAKAGSACEVPAGYAPVTAIAIGRPGDPAQLPDTLREREAAPRVRKPLREFVFGAAWDTPLAGVTR